MSKKTAFMSMTMIILFLTIALSFTVEKTITMDLIILGLNLLHLLINYFYFIRNKRKESTIPSYYDTFMVFFSYFAVDKVLDIVAIIVPKLEISMKFISIVALFFAFYFITDMGKKVKQMGKKLEW